MTVSEYIFGFLQKKGCDTVFMVSGSSAMWLTDALQRNEKLKAICCQHEQVAAMAADGYGRTKGIPGVCLVTVGPGATNAITGVAGAFVDSSPQFILSGQTNSNILKYQDETKIRQKGTQSIGLKEMVSNITKYFAEILDEGEIRYHMEKAYHEAMSGRKGPVWLDIPVDIQNRQIPSEMKGYTPKEEEYVYPVDDVLDMLKTAKKPLVLAGYGIIEAGAKEVFLDFINKFKIPVVTSRGGIGAIGSTHNLFIGRPGNYGDRASHFAIQECDLLLVLGSRLSVSTIGYYPQRFAGNAKKILVEIDKKELAKNDVPVDLKIHGNVHDFLKKITAENIDLGSDYDLWIEHCRLNREKYPVVLDEYRNEEEINGYYFTQKLSQAAPDNAAVVVDTGSVCNIVSQSWKLKKNQDYMISGGLSAMGFWASAVGIGATGREVIAVSGDGSTQMNVQDFATMQYYHLPIKLFIYNNHGYLLIRHNQHNYMNDRFLGVGADSGVPDIDFCKIASAYGLRSVRIESKEEIDAKVKEVLQMKGPVICEVMVQEFGILAPRIASRVMSDGTLKAAEYEDLWPFLDEK